jgi:pimeloyl-ACP methyl ester carboxylesterase
MSCLYRIHCCLFDFLLTFQSDDLLARYGDEMRLVFRDALRDAWQAGPTAICGVWSEILGETIVLTTPRYAARLRLVFAATVLATALTVGTALGFCAIGDSPVVRAACSQEESNVQSAPQTRASDGLFQLPNGHRMFLECSGDPNAEPSVILANGRGLGAADAWAKVQQRVPSSIRTCSYDAIGAGRSDPFQPHPELRPIDQVVSEMHGLFQAAHLKQPYVLVGASAGGILIRRYQQERSSDVAGMVFVDSSHEEMLWRFAAIPTPPDPNWKNPVFLRDNGFLPDHQKLTWHADIPLVVLERTEKPPRSDFSTQQQFDAYNAEWHNFQVDLAGRSKFGQLRIVANSGHRMHEDRPDAIADAIRDVVQQVRAGH